MKLLYDNHLMSCMPCLGVPNPFSSIQGGKYSMGRPECTPRASADVRDSSPCSKQITNTSRAVSSSALSCWESGNESFLCARSESLSKQRAHHLPVSPGVPFRATHVRPWAGRLRKALPVLSFCTCGHKSLVSMSVSLVFFTTKWEHLLCSVY